MDHLSARVNLYISGRKLRDTDFFSKSDPICIVAEMREGKWSEVGRTEQILNNLNPNFETMISMQYFFEREQNLKFTMLDGDGHGDSDPIGEVTTKMGHLIGAPA